ncbi:glycosyltransferase family 4 protein [Cupriavidus sp. WKF15]|uniref:glycosyltransferase family 4 protein n=1 Tax=Cupriavidus sp. WKF15 TaxID=3032282 RepID=UPI0023E0DAF8|nr:glycosyltransferase family 4 protein [Cupriavidus sp. WKF15]WER45219.1 glycosyltransferase family 4 protein [Cupriavidus sp. WKF15]
MKIAQIAPLQESCPPRHYGGTERVVAYLTNELVRLGHDVTLFASADSSTAARLVSCVPRALRSDPSVRDFVPYHAMMLDEVLRRADDFDILHFHTELLHFPMVRSFAHRTVTTLHGRLDLPDLWPFYSVFPDIPLVSVSLGQRGPMPPVSWLGNVYHGLPEQLLPFHASGRGGYLAFLGRISPEKRPDRAIEIAVRSGLPLKIAAKIDRVDRAYWEADIAPLLSRHANVEYLGEIGQREKMRFLGDARALLFPIDWPEPFGLAMIEAMACGTPVIAFRCGSVPEIVDDGVTGFVVDSIDEAVAAVGRIGDIDRRGVRRAFQARFSAERMANDYLALYGRLHDPASGNGRPYRDQPADPALHIAA